MLREISVACAMRFWRMRMPAMARGPNARRPLCTSERRRPVVARSNARARASSARREVGTLGAAGEAIAERNVGACGDRTGEREDVAAAMLTVGVHGDERLERAFLGLPAWLEREAARRLERCALTEVHRVSRDDDAQAGRRNAQHVLVDRRRAPVVDEEHADPIAGRRSPEGTRSVLADRAGEVDEGPGEAPFLVERRHEHGDAHAATLPYFQGDRGPFLRVPSRRLRAARGLVMVLRLGCRALQRRLLRRSFRRSARRRGPRSGHRSRLPPRRGRLRDDARLRRRLLSRRAASEDARARRGALRDDAALGHRPDHRHRRRGRVADPRPPRLRAGHAHAQHRRCASGAHASSRARSTFPSTDDYARGVASTVVSARRIPPACLDRDHQDDELRAAGPRAARGGVTRRRRRRRHHARRRRLARVRDDGEPVPREG